MVGRDDPVGDAPDGDAPENGDGGPRTDAFELVGDETRASILRTLGDAWTPGEPRPVLSFSTLRERVPGDLRSSRFNYHLQQLVGDAVAKTDAGYRLTPAGEALYRAMIAERFETPGSLDPFPVGLACHYCDGDVRARYEDGSFVVQCPDCDARYFDSTRVPPGALADRDALLERVATHDRHRLLAFAQGVCPTCANALERQVLPAVEAAFPTDDRDDVLVFQACDHCGIQDYRRVGEMLLCTPAVVSFYASHDVEVLARPKWAFAFAATDEHLTVEATDPWRLTVACHCDGDVREVTVDGDLTVLDVEDR
jgi:hypothetical protein